jgi:hypothetical protein
LEEQQRIDLLSEAGGAGAGLAGKVLPQRQRAHLAMLLAGSEEVECENRERQAREVEPPRV